MPGYHCPLCGGVLREVFYNPCSLLNRDQWQALRAGDFCCDTCPGDESWNGKKYFWRRELAPSERETAMAPQVQVSGRLEGSFADLEARLLRLIVEEQEQLAPDTIRLAVLCDAVRGLRELLVLSQRVQPGV